LGHRDASDGALLGADDVTNPMRQTGLGAASRCDRVKRKVSRTVRSMACPSSSVKLNATVTRRTAWDDLYLRYPCW
jgi:hypothetical protein